jgi:hypothetical protein
MGPNFDKGKTRIGRERLPPGIVAILDDQEMLRGAILELLAYATDVHTAEKMRRGIVYRLVSDAERQAITYKLQDFFGMKRFLPEERTYTVPTGHWHFMDDRAVSHANTRHGIVETGSSAGHLALAPLDFCQVPSVVHSRNIVEFCVTKGMPRIVYEQAFDEGTLRVVEEIQAQAGLAFKTCYRKR